MAQTFKQWLAQVDSLIEREVGMSMYDLPDVSYRDMYDGGETPQEAADQALDEAGWEG